MSRRDEANQTIGIGRSRKPVNQLMIEQLYKKQHELQEELQKINEAIHALNRLEED